MKPAETKPQYLSFYTDALNADGIGFDVYDVDANGRTAPDVLGVLSHYDAVIWYTGDDVVTREPGWGPGNASRLAMQELLEVRDFLNEGGRVLYTGQRPGSSTPRRSARSSTTRSRTGNAAATPPSKRAAWHCRGPVTPKATRSSTPSEPPSPQPAADSIRTPRSPSRSPESTIH